ncbi:P-loop containing nucleoside triphosphate hydrolase protein [Aspergillus bertholletiae]|uniref:P-loop containing nucleoside triphosphate hydrolase protein n=1 Tax=Aspergillus bertholletiae TaxID=1226010 RepID=A0A5N7BF55_9EURO|nr:P-loop containing nucleoside triphosphate hydrolase protein [Aspergillus bertholletiae]
MSFNRKVVVVGDTGCGKTSLILAFTQGSPASGELPTTAELLEVDSPVPGSQVSLSLWDTANRGDFEQLRDICYTVADIILICFSIDSPQSLSNVKEQWALKALHFCSTTPTILVGCKKDLRREPDPKPSNRLSKVMKKLAIRKEDPRSDENTKLNDTLSPVQPKQVTSKEATKVCYEIGAKAYLECSAVTLEGVQQVFETAARAMIHYRSN